MILGESNGAMYRQNELLSKSAQSLPQTGFQPFKRKILPFVAEVSLGWFAFGSIEYLIIHAVMIAAYIMIWLIQYLIYKQKVRELNRELENWKAIQNGNKK